MRQTREKTAEGRYLCAKKPHDKMGLTLVTLE